MTYIKSGGAQLNSTLCAPFRRISFVRRSCKISQ